MSIGLVLSRSAGASQRMMNVPTIEAIVKIHRKSLSRTIATKPQSWSSCGTKRNYKIKHFHLFPLLFRAWRALYARRWTRLAAVCDAEWTSRYVKLSQVRRDTSFWALRRLGIHLIRTLLWEVHCIHRYLQGIYYAQSCAVHCILKRIALSRLFFLFTLCSVEG